MQCGREDGNRSLTVRVPPRHTDQHAITTENKGAPPWNQVLLPPHVVRSPSIALMRMQTSYDIAQARKREGDIELVPFEEQVA